MLIDVDQKNYQKKFEVDNSFLHNQFDRTRTRFNYLRNGSSMSTQRFSNSQIKFARIKARVQTLTDESIKNLKNRDIKLLSDIDNRISNCFRFTQKEFDACETERDVDILLEDKKTKATALVNHIIRTAQNSLRNNTERCDSKADAMKSKLASL